MMEWHKLTNLSDIDELLSWSEEQPIIVFKHSTRCSISSSALDRIERKWKIEEAGYIRPYYLDLLQYRDLSNAIAEKFKIQHESPQLLIIRHGKAVAHYNHYEINYQVILDYLNSLQKQS